MGKERAAGRVRTVLFGGTDLTLSVADELRELGLPVAGAVFVPEEFAISYAPEGATNVRYADMESWALTNGVPAIRWTGVDACVDFVDKVAGDLGLAAGWYHMVPARLREKFPKGCAGLHASLLPELRGGAPLNWAILSARSETGVSLFELGGGVDDGPIYGQRTFSIGARATVGDLVTAARAASLELVADVLPKLATDSIVPRLQTGSPSYCLQRTPSDGLIDWTQSAEAIDRLVRATTRPYPGAFTYLDGEQVTIWRSDLAPSVPVLGSAGQVFRLPDEDDPCVVAGDGNLVIRDATDADGVSCMDVLVRAANRRFRSPRPTCLHTEYGHPDR